jgi:hypothetical protein
MTKKNPHRVAATLDRSPGKRHCLSGSCFPPITRLGTAPAVPPSSPTTKAGPCTGTKLRKAYWFSGSRVVARRGPA